MVGIGAVLMEVTAANINIVFLLDMFWIETVEMLRSKYNKLTLNKKSMRKGINYWVKTKEVIF